MKSAISFRPSALADGQNMKRKLVREGMLFNGNASYGRLQAAGRKWKMVIKHGPSLRLSLCCLPASGRTKVHPYNINRAYGSNM
jgi:hypothetical protein